MKWKTKKICKEMNTIMIPSHTSKSTASLRSLANAATSSKISSWAIVVSLLLQLASGERQAVVRVQPGDVVVHGFYSRSGPDGLNITGKMRTMTNNCRDEDNDVTSSQTDDDGRRCEGQGGDGEEWVGIFYLPPLEGSAGAQGGTGCSLLEQVKQAMLFGASALLVLALNPGLFKEIELHLTSDIPIILISDAKEVKTFQRNVHLRKSKHVVNITAKPESTAKLKTITAPRLTLWSTCGRSSGGSRFREWEGTVCLDPKHASAEHGLAWIWRSLLSLLISFYIVNLFRGLAHHPRPNSSEDLEETLQRLARQSVSKMPVWKYKRKKYQLSAESTDCCAVCLDEFFKGQNIRMLPCHHQFHNKCVDSWLIHKRTCPLCKLDIIDQRFGLGKKC